jgi:capsular exopolysaccharide synthesis family protein
MRRMSAHAEVVKFLLSRQQEAEISRASTLASADFIDPAAPPLEPSGPSLPLHLILGALCGLALSIGIASAKESLGRGVFTAAELESVTQLPVLGTIPDFRHGPFRVRTAREDFVPLRDDPEGPVAEAYRSLRANLKFALSGEKRIQTLAVTSCTPGEGKSMTNIGLALALARTGKRVLIVDADMRLPSVHSYLGVALSPGLSDLLCERNRWRDCVRRAIEPNLDVIGAGRQPPNPSDLLDSPALTALLAEWREQYDFIVFDVPPALAVSDIDSIAAQLDALLLLAKSNKVASHIVAAAASRLRQVGANLIGTVLNAVGTSTINKRHGYGYGYGYGTGYGQRTTDRSPERIAS